VLVVELSAPWNPDYRMAGLPRNGWPKSIGISGRFPSEYAEKAHYSMATKKYETLFPAKNCAQIVPVKVKFFQFFPNETKNDF
jgi:hypothetical protein